MDDPILVATPANGPLEISYPGPGRLNILESTGKELLAIHADGTVTGSMEDASEAAAIFVREVRRLFGVGPG
jgi:hypothetical protein